MKRNNLVFKSLLKSHFASLLGIFVFVAIVSGIFCSLFTVLHSTSFYEKSMLEKGQFGDVSYWLTNFTSENEKNDLIKNISELESVNSVNAQNLVMANYEVHHTESDSEGCFIVDDGRYSVATQLANAELEIGNGECFVPFSFSEIYEDVEIGETIDVIVGRNGLSKTLTVAGFFEDPFMGSTMLGMKTILISQEDFEEIALMSKNAGIDALARSGILLHISADGEKENFSQFLNENTNISKFTEDVHSTETMMNFMMLLSNSFAAMFGSFAIVLFFVTAFVLFHSIKSAIGDERKNFGIYKELGYTTKNLALNFSKIVMIPILCGGIFGFVLSPIFSKLILKMQISTTSLFVPVKIPFLVCSGFLILLFVLLLVFVFLSIRGIKNISPLSTIRELGIRNKDLGMRNAECGIEKDERHAEFISASDLMNDRLGIRNEGSSIRKNGLLFWIAFRQVVSKKRNYLATLIISILLVIFASFAGRINSWLGKNGEGLMDAFNPTNLHLGVQSFGEQTIEDFESIIKEYSEINEHYVLGMPTLRLNGKDYTANVTDSPEHFHIFEGRVCENENEIVITEFLLKDLGLKIGDVVKIGSRYVRGEDFTIVGTYQCANDVGENFGMTQNGYFRIGRDNPSLWCHHYLLKDETKKKEIMKVLEEKFGSDVHVHENAWPGLYGILTAMKMLIFFMYGVSGLFILIAIILSGKKILNEEKTDLNNYRLLGFSYSSLRLSFSIRFLIVSVFGSGIALLLSELISDSLINILMRSAGIAGFSSHLGLQQMLLPSVIITFMFVLCAWIFGKKIRNWR